MDERSYNQPTFKNDPDYTKCEHCNGDGYTYEMIEGEVTKEKCHYCEDGWIEIED